MTTQLPAKELTNEHNAEEFKAEAIRQNIAASRWLQENFTTKDFLSNSARPHDEDKLLRIAKLMRQNPLNIL